jgi:hypothetical protein
MGLLRHTAKNIPDEFTGDISRNNTVVNIKITEIEIKPSAKFRMCTLSGGTGVLAFYFSEWQQVIYDSVTSADTIT